MLEIKSEIIEKFQQAKKKNISQQQELKLLKPNRVEAYQIEITNSKKHKVQNNSARLRKEASQQDVVLNSPDEHFEICKEAMENWLRFKQEEKKITEQMKKDLVETSLTNDYEKWRMEVLQKMYRKHEGYAFNSKALN